MRVVVGRRAAKQLDEILSYIDERNPQGARAVQQRIREVLDLLSERPLIGFATGYRDGRRLLTSPYPYVIYYRVRGDAVFIQRIRHSARRPM